MASKERGRGEVWKEVWRCGEEGDGEKSLKAGGRNNETKGEEGCNGNQGKTPAWR